MTLNHGSKSSIPKTEKMNLKGSKESESGSKEEGIKHLLTEQMVNTTMHGLPRVHCSSNNVKRCAWLIFVLVGLGMICWQVTIAVLKCLSNPVQTTISVHYEGQLMFPAVTFCNMNPLKKSAIGYITSNPAIKELLKQTNMSIDLWDPVTTAQSVQVDFQDKTLRPNHLLSSLPLQERINVGHSKENMLIDCKFDGVRCEIDYDFTVFSDMVYGNCFTFNTFAYDDTDLNWSTLYHSRNVGPEFGLELTLNVEQVEYLRLTDYAGVRVVIHNQTEVPLPRENGFNVPTGQSTYVGMWRTDDKREKPPYGKCGTYTGRQLYSVNMYKDNWPYLVYSQQACFQTCYQEQVVYYCGCGDPYYPLNSSALFKRYQGSVIKPCLSDVDVECNYGTYDVVVVDNEACYRQCPQECKKTYHNLQISTATWPSNIMESTMEDRLKSLARPDLAEILGNYSTEWERKTHVRDNFLNLHIYFGDISRVYQETNPSYLVTDLLSDLGGLMGLYLGMSVMTAFEFIELLGDMLALCCVANKNAVQEIKPR